jgi:hypothetical protein
MTPEDVDPDQLDMIHDFVWDTDDDWDELTEDGFDVWDLEDEQ